MTHEPGSLRARLKDSSAHAWRLYCALELIIPYQESSRSAQVAIRRQRLTASPIPWNATAAGLAMEFHAEVRRLEVHLAERISGSLSKRRGGSPDNTRYALLALSNLAERVDDQTVLSVLNTLDRWNRKADAAFHPEKGLHRIPREPGQGEMRCPYCTFQTVRWLPATGIIVCINPECHTDAGVRPRWIADFVLDGDDLQFSWQPIGQAA